MLKNNLAGITLTGSNGDICTVHGIPQETNRGLDFHWSYLNVFMNTLWESGLTKVQFIEKLQARMLELEPPMVVLIIEDGTELSNE